MTRRRLLLGACVLALLVAGSAVYALVRLRAIVVGQGPQVLGPSLDATTLGGLPDHQRTMALSTGAGRIDLHDLTTGEVSVVDAGGTVRDLTGPDDQGRLVCRVEDPSSMSCVVVQLQRGSAVRRVLAQSPKICAWEQERLLALAPTGGLLALGREAGPRVPLLANGHGPTMRRVEIISLEAPETTRHEFTSAGQPGWFEAGRELVYGDWTELDRAAWPADLHPDLRALATRLGWQALPRVRVLDTNSNTTRTVGWGLQPMAAGRGLSVLARVSDTRYVLTDLQSGTSSEHVLGHALETTWWWPAGVAVLGDSLLVYHAACDEESQPGWIVGGVIQRRSCLRILDLATGADRWLAQGCGPDWAGPSWGWR